MLNDPDPVKSQRVMKAMLPMGKIDIKILKQVYNGKQHYYCTSFLGWLDSY